MQSLKGQLLVAGPSLLDPNFRRTVVLVGEHTDEGARMRRRVVACDIVELSPLPGIVAPNFLVSKLIYKIITYKYAGR